MTIDNIIQTQRLHEIRQLMQMGLCREDAEDVYQEASIVLLQTVREQRLTVMGKPEAYLYGVCRNQAMKRLEELKRMCDTVDDERLDRLLELTEEAHEGLADDDAAEVDYLQLLHQMLRRLPDRDLALLHGFYLEGKSMEQLALEHNLASVEVVRTTKCRIISRLREQADKMINELF